MFKQTYTHLTLEFVLKILKFPLFILHTKSIILESKIEPFFCFKFQIRWFKDCHMECECHYYYRCPSSDSDFRGSHRSQTVRNVQPKIVRYKID